ncbi:MAG: hypothetical protein KDI55_26840 [Anaerolineae bacterium]|nr:hypothetical protein [Anaerolineae bacterium]
MMKKQLDWGQTPWDNLTREELLRTVQKMYITIETQNHVLSNIVQFRRHEPYWSGKGVGGRALEMARQIIQPVILEWEVESLYRSFYRYAEDLLFDCSKHEQLGKNWAVCPKCGTMLGSADHFGKPCWDTSNCDGIMRPLTWDDMKPKPTTEIDN